MHSISSKSSSFHYHFNPDLSGDLLITQSSGAEGFVFQFPAKDILEIAAKWAMEEKIRKIEQMDAKEVLLSS